MAEHLEKEQGPTPAANVAGICFEIVREILDDCTTYTEEEIGKKVLLNQELTGEENILTVR